MIFVLEFPTHFYWCFRLFLAQRSRLLRSGRAFTARRRLCAGSSKSRRGGSTLRSGSRSGARWAFERVDRPGAVKRKATFRFTLPSVSWCETKSSARQLTVSRRRHMVRDEISRETITGSHLPFHCRLLEEQARKQHLAQRVPLPNVEKFIIGHFQR